MTHLEAFTLGVAVALFLALIIVVNNIGGHKQGKLRRNDSWVGLLIALILIGGFVFLILFPS